ncbi:discoidin domain-containing protein [Campylobacter jejuni]|nr:discoidin domain-containing protein [Campylobacter jejuni]
MPFLWSNATTAGGDAAGRWRGSSFKVNYPFGISEIIVKSTGNLDIMELWEISESAGNFTSKLATGSPVTRTGEKYLTVNNIALQAGKSYAIVFRQQTQTNGNFFYATTGSPTEDPNFTALTVVGGNTTYPNYSGTTAPVVGDIVTGNGNEVAVGFTYRVPINKYLFQDGEDIKKRDKILSNDTKDVTPIMKAANVPAPYVVAASSQKDATNYPAWKVFAGGQWEAYMGSTPQWLSLDFGSQKIIKKYEVGCYLYNSNAPTDFLLQGSNDNSNWETLDTQSAVKWSTSNEIKQFGIPNNIVPYRYYRIYVTASVGGTYLTLTKFRLHEAILVDVWSVVGTAPATKAMFDTDGMTDLSMINHEAIQGLVSGTPELLCWTDEVTASRTTNLTAIPHPQLLLPTGDIEVGELKSVKVEANVQGEYSDNLVPTMTSHTLPSGKVSYSSYSSSNYPYKVFNKDITDYGWLSNGKSNEWIQYQFPEPKKVARYIIYGTNYDPKSSPMKWDLMGSNDEINWEILDSRDNIINWIKGEKREFDIGTDKIKFFTHYRLFVYLNNGQGSYIAISEIELKELLPGEREIKVIVSPDSGATWQGKGPVTVTDLASVKASGWTPAEFNAFTKDQLASLFPNGKVRLAFYLEQDKSTDIVKVDSVEVNEIKYKYTPSLIDAAIVYESSVIQRPAYYVSRNDGVDWLPVNEDEVAKLDKLPEGKDLRVKAVLQNGLELHGISFSWI